LRPVDDGVHDAERALEGQRRRPPVAIEPTLDASNAVIAEASERYAKALWRSRIVAQAATRHRWRRSGAGLLGRRRDAAPA
jgi:hypothetical protein